MNLLVLFQRLFVVLQFGLKKKRQISAMYFRLHKEQDNCNRVQLVFHDAYKQESFSVYTSCTGKKGKWVENRTKML